MRFIDRNWGKVLALVTLSAAAGWASCALPGYSVGESGSSGQTGSGGGGVDSGSGSGGQGGDTQGVGGKNEGGNSGAGGDLGECQSDDQCKHLFQICVKAFCDKSSGPAGQCKLEPINAPSTNLKPGAVGDCKSVVCESGKLTVNPAADDIDNDMNECTKDLCSETLVVHKSNSGADCTLNVGKLGVCVGTRCLECDVNKPCTETTTECKLGKCIAPTCKNGFTDGSETDIDCGGPNCFPCGGGFHCEVKQDCESQECDVLTGKCNPPGCNDSVQNGEETDVGCGGVACLKCDVDKHCGINTDCISGICRGGLCRAPTCEDWLKGPGEEGIDCGGPCSIKCP